MRFIEYEWAIPAVHVSFTVRGRLLEASGDRRKEDANNESGLVVREKAKVTSGGDTRGTCERRAAYAASWQDILHSVFGVLGA